MCLFYRAFVESGLDFDFKSLPTGEAAAQMWSKSPLQYADQVKFNLWSALTQFFVHDSIQRGQGFKFYLVLGYVLEQHTLSPLVRVN